MSGIAINILRYFVSLMLLGAIWWLIVLIFGLPPYVLPAPNKVLHTLWTEYSWLSPHCLSTLKNAAIGGGLGIGLGVLVGFAVAYFRSVRWVVEPYLVIFQSFPREALVPVIIVWLGFGAGPKILNAAILSFFPMAILTMSSILDTRFDYLELVRNWGSSKWQEYRHCRLPFALYTIAGGLKITVPLALIGAVLGEFMGGNNGLGYVIVSSGANFRMDRSFAAIVLLAMIGIFAFAAVRVIQDIALINYKQE